MRYPFRLPVMGTPVTGLSPVIEAFRKLDGTAPEAAEPIVGELDPTNAPGWYYIDIDTDEHIVVTVDGTATLSTTYRYHSFEVRPQILANETITWTRWDVRGNPLEGTIDGFQGDETTAARSGTVVATYDATGRVVSVTRKR